MKRCSLLYWAGAQWLADLHVRVRCAQEVGPRQALRGLQADPHLHGACG